ncbi:hypothetical protein MRX96_042021 [Rhipicephalus microplus]
MQERLQRRIDPHAAPTASTSLRLFVAPKCRVRVAPVSPRDRTTESGAACVRHCCSTREEWLLPILALDGD